MVIDLILIINMYKQNLNKSVIKELFRDIIYSILK